MPAQVLPDLTRTVPNLTGVRAANVVRNLTTTKLYMIGESLMFTLENRQKAHNEINHIFKDLLPVQDMAERPEQVALPPDPGPGLAGSGGLPPGERGGPPEPDHCPAGSGVS